jgi:hypothetical protein
MSLVLEWLWSMITHWQSWVSGGGLGGLILIVLLMVEKFHPRGWTMPKRWYAVIIGAFFVLGASFMAWRDERVLADQQGQEITAKTQKISGLETENKRLWNDDSQFRQAKPAQFIESKNSLRRKTIKVANDLVIFWSKHPQPSQLQLQGPVAEQYWRDTNAAYSNAGFNERILGIVRQYKAKGVNIGWLEQAAEQPERLWGSAPFGGTDCFVYPSELCQLRELAYHVDAQDNLILLKQE